jgi:hypothetical protein
MSKKRMTRVAGGRDAALTVANERIEAMTGLAVETAKRHGEPFRNPFLSGHRRLYPLKYVAASRPANG